MSPSLSGRRLRLPGVGRSGAARTTRSMSRPVSRPFAVASRWLPAASSSVDPSHGSASTGSPASSAAVEPCTRTGSGAPSSVTRSSRHPLSKLGGMVAATIPERLADRRRLDDRFPVAAVEHDAWIDAEDGQLHRPGRQRLGEGDRAGAGGVGRRHGDIRADRSGRDAQAGDRGVVAAGLGDRHRVGRCRRRHRHARTDRPAERRRPCRRRVAVGERPAGRGGRAGEPAIGLRPGDAEQPRQTSRQWPAGRGAR